MHQESHQIVNSFEASYVCGKGYETILDVGSKDVNGTYADIFSNYEYTGVDVEPGNNVDIIAEPYRLSRSIDKLYDVAICGNVIEHVARLETFFIDLAHCIKHGGLLCVVTPTDIHEHRHPLDCWRILPDGLRHLLDVSSFDVLKVEVTDGQHKDLFGVATRR